MPVLIALLTMLLSAGPVYPVSAMSDNVGGPMARSAVTTMDNVGGPMAMSGARGSVRHTMDNIGGPM